MVITCKKKWRSPSLSLRHPFAMLSPDHNLHFDLFQLWASKWSFDFRWRKILHTKICLKMLKKKIRYQMLFIHFRFASVLNFSKNS